MPIRKTQDLTEPTRRSTRVVPVAVVVKSKVVPVKNAAPAKPTASKKRAKTDSESEDEPESEEDKPTKKAKVTKVVAVKKTPAVKAVVSKAKAGAEGSSTSGGLQIGDTIPEITLKNEKDEDVDVKELASKGLVLFLVPKANTPGCTKQACAYRDSYSDFTKLGYTVYCLSADKSVAQAKWQTSQNLPYPLLSDPSRQLIKVIGAGSDKTTRSHFIFEKGTGKLIDKQVPVVSTKSSALALIFLQEYKPSTEA